MERLSRENKILNDGSLDFGRGIIGPTTSEVDNQLQSRGRRFRLPKKLLPFAAAVSLLIVACGEQRPGPTPFPEATSTPQEIPGFPESPDIPKIQRPSVINPQLLDSFNYRIIIQVKQNIEIAKLDKGYYTQSSAPDDLNYDKSSYWKVEGIKGVNFYSNIDPSLGYEDGKYRLTIENAFCPVDGPNIDWDKGSLASFGCSGSVLTRFSTVTSNEVVIIGQKKQ